MVQSMGNLLPSPTLSCRFGLMVVKAAFLSTALLRCTAPQQSNEGTVGLSVSTNGIDFEPSGVQFTYITPPKLLDISPTSGTAAGGYDVTITGEHFRKTEHLMCIVGGTTTIVATFLSDTSVVCSMPSTDTVGNTTVYVSNFGMSESSEHMVFEYVKTVEAQSLLPSTGPTRSGGTLTLQGSGLDALFNSGWFSWTRCQLASVVSSEAVTSAAKLMSDGSVQCSRPALGDKGVWNVSLETSWGASSNVLEFSAYDEPPISMVSPNYGGYDSEVEVSIFGARFPNTDDIICRFGDVGSVAAVRVRVSLIKCVTPTASAT